MSLASILSIARTALLTQQKAVGVTSHNIANATTEGYSRQTLPLTALDPLRTPDGTIGRGVDSGAIQRARDTFLDAGVRRESGTAGESSTSSDLLTQVDSVLDGLGTSSLATGLDAFFNSFSDLANDPSNPTARALAQQSGLDLARQFNSVDQRLTQLGDDATAKLSGLVSQVNDIAGQIAGLNTDILASARNGTAPDLEDSRDLLIDKLSNLVGVNVVPHEDGTVGVLVGSVLLVDGGGAQKLAVMSAPSGGLGLGYAGSTTTFPAGSGQIKALLDFTSTTLPGIRGKLDTLAAGVVSEVNALHQQGITPAGTTGTDFFDATGVTAGTMRLDAAIADPTTGANAIAAGTYNASSPVYAPGDGSIALKIAQLRTTGAASVGGSTLSDYYTSIVGTVALSAQSAQSSADAHATLLSNVQARRSSVTDVSTDEEMVNLMRQQQAYAAASRIVTVANEMMQSVLQMI